MSAYEMDHNLQINFLYMFAIEPDPNPVRRAGFYKSYMRRSH